jgi:hypothetical protein
LLFSVTVTPGSRLLWASTTVPCTDALVVCANSTDGWIKKSRATLTQSPLPRPLTKGIDSSSTFVVITNRNRPVVDN